MNDLKNLVGGMNTDNLKDLANKMKDKFEDGIRIQCKNIGGTLKGSCCYKENVHGVQRLGRCNDTTTAQVYLLL